MKTYFYVNIPLKVPAFRPRFSRRNTTLSRTLVCTDVLTANCEHFETLVVNPTTGKSVPADVWVESGLSYAW